MAGCDLRGSSSSLAKQWVDPALSWPVTWATPPPRRHSQAVMREPLKSLLQLPVERVAGPVVQAAPWPVKPPGL